MGMIRELKCESLALNNRLKRLMSEESCYSKVVKLFNKDFFPLSPNLCLQNFADRVGEGCRNTTAIW